MYLYPLCIHRNYVFCLISFVSETTSWGESIKTINGVTADTEKYMYWQLLGPGDKSLTTGNCN